MENAAERNGSKTQRKKGSGRLTAPTDQRVLGSQMENVLSINAYSGPKTQVRHSKIWKSLRPVECLTESLPFRLRGLHNEILEETKKEMPWWHRSERRFRQNFCKIVRNWAGLSLEEVCSFLNEHPQILELRKLPGASRFFPITPDLLDNLENNIHALIEYNPYGGGMLGIAALGVPTNTLAMVLSEACGTSKHYWAFETWCEQYMTGRHLTSNQNGVP